MERLRRLFRSRKAKVALACFLLNELRGLGVVIAFLVAAHGRLF